jgi:hypothetical protein
MQRKSPRNNRRANEMTIDETPAAPVYGGFGAVMTDKRGMDFGARRNALE